MNDWGYLLPQATFEAVRSISLDQSIDELKASFWERSALFESFAKGDVRGLSVLRFYLSLLSDVKSRYEEMEIPSSVFFDSIKDITIWCEDYLLKHSEAGFSEWEWIGKTLRMEVIRIGRLQFEPSVLAKDVSVDGRVCSAGIPVLEVHIPAGEGLDTTSVLDSFARAPEFFKTYFGKEFSLFHCRSWLLSPDLDGLLSESSRIIHFKNLFTVYGTDQRHRQAEERVFGFLSDEPCDYPEATSLQRAVKQHLLCGGCIAMGSGIRFI